MITILIVDDETTLRKALVFDFKRKGYRVFEAGSGNEAFKIVQTESIDLILSDLRMPDGDGVELLERIRQQGAKPALMFISGFSDMTVVEAYTKGAEAVFTKPFDRKALFEAVSRFASRFSQTSEDSRQFERLDIVCNADLRFSESDSAVQGKALNIGQGGLFIALSGQLPAVGTKVSFTVYFETGTVKVLEGSGIVRWVRASEEKQPSGVGIEFELLTEQSAAQLIEIVNNLKTVRG